MEMMRKKVEERPELTIKDQSGNTVLHIAVMNANTQLVSFFLYHEAVIDCLNKNLQTPLMLACAKGFEEIT